METGVDNWSNSTEMKNNRWPEVPTPLPVADN